MRLLRCQVLTSSPPLSSRCTLAVMLSMFVLCLLYFPNWSILRITAEVAASSRRLHQSPPLSRNHGTAHLFSEGNISGQFNFQKQIFLCYRGKGSYQEVRFIVARGSEILGLRKYHYCRSWEHHFHGTGCSSEL